MRTVKLFVIFAIILIIEIINAEWCTIKWYESFDESTGTMLIISGAMITPFVATTILACKLVLNFLSSRGRVI